MTPGEKLRSRRENKGWTLEELARRLHIRSKSYISNLENGYAPIGPKMRLRLAKIFDCGPSEFAAEDIAAPAGIVADSLAIASDLPRVPVLGAVSADRFSFSFDAFAEDHLPIPMERGRKLFALKISGDCMEPTFRDKDYVILSETQQVVDGRVVLAHLDGEFTLKRYFKRADHIELKPDNGKYKSIKIASRHLVIKGVVVGIYRKDI